MTTEQWLEVFRGIGKEMRAGLPAILDLETGRTAIGRGAGGDKTFPVDKWAEDIMVAAMEQVHATNGAAFTLVSEELGTRTFGAGTQVVLVDPVDGSNNAKNGVPFFGFAIALLDGSTLAELKAGYVMNLAVGDEFWAVRGKGAFKNGKTLRTPDTADIVIVSYEATDPANDLPLILPLLTSARRTRCFGSTALDLTYLASGATSVFVTATPSRTFDYAAGMLILEEAGGIVTDWAGSSLGSVRAGLDRTVPLLAAKNSVTHQKALALLRKN
ncbi:MAG: hypothetical protein OEW15_11250 [Nitrospirota bacterium]|nr:hypothetical protein [Nitrospirota bacterium]